MSRAITSRFLVHSTCLAFLFLTPIESHAGFFKELAKGWKKITTQTATYDPRFDDFKRMVEAGKIADAVKYRSANLEYFNSLEPEKKTYAYQQFENQLYKQLSELVSDAPAAAFALYIQSVQQEPVSCAPENKAVCDALFVSLAADYTETADRAFSKIEPLAQTSADASNWVPLKRGVLRLTTQLQGDAKTSLPPPLSDAIKKAQARLDLLTSKLEAAAPEAIRLYGLAQMPPFPDVYPISVDMSTLIKDLSLDGISNLPLGTLRSINLSYGQYLNEAQQRELATAYMAKVHKERRPGYFAANEAIKQAKADGFMAPDNERPIIAWHYADLDESIRFNLADTPDFNVKVAEREDKPAKLTESVKTRNKGLLVFTYSGTENAQRAEIASTRYDSASLAGQQRIRNPDYDSAVRRVSNAESNFAAANKQAQNLNTNSTGWAILAATNQALAKSDLANARRVLAETPMMINQEVQDKYSFVVKRIVLSKHKPIRYLAIDPETARRCEGETTLEVTHEFQVAMDIRSNDVNFKNLSERGWINEPTLETQVRSADFLPYSNLMSKVLDACREQL